MRPLYSGILRKAITANQPFLLSAAPMEDFLTIQIGQQSKTLGDGFFIQEFNNTNLQHFIISESLKIPFEDFHFYEELNLPKFVQSNPVTESEYLKKINRAIEEIRNGKFKKVVLSRAIAHPFENKKVFDAFEQLLHQNPHAFRYLLFTGTEYWMGATPELLLEKNGNNYTTMALAGTKLPHDSWTNKEEEEQKMVTDFIVEKLQLDASAVDKTETVKAGNVEHLRNWIRWQSHENDFLNIINQLHPTSAVCGLPRHQALNWLLKNEGYKRGLYSGLIGMKSGDQTKVFVNLRCAQLFDEQSIIYVGGGITEASDAAKEWQETNRKAELMKSVLD